jgi:hypothetical protein
MSRYQASHGAAFPDDYRLNGLLALRRNKTAQPRYEKTLAALTAVIERALSRKPLPPLEPPLAFDQLIDAFDNPGRYNVRVGVLHEKGIRWPLAPELGRTVHRVVESVTASLRVHWRALRIGDDVRNELEGTVPAREAVIVLADNTQLDQGAFLVHRNAVDEGAASNCVVLVGEVGTGANAKKPQEIQERLEKTFPRLTKAGQTRWFATDSLEALEKVLAENIARIRSSLVGEDPAAHVVAPDLVEAAKGEGIFVDSRPLVDGPGAERA